MDGRGRSDEKTRTEEYRWNSSVGSAVLREQIDERGFFGGGVEGERRWFDTVIVWAVPSTERVELALGRYDGR